MTAKTTAKSASYTEETAGIQSIAVMEIYEYNGDEIAYIIVTAYLSQNTKRFYY